MVTWIYLREVIDLRWEKGRIHLSEMGILTSGRLNHLAISDNKGVSPYLYGLRILGGKTRPRHTVIGKGKLHPDDTQYPMWIHANEVGVLSTGIVPIFC
jgi:hypothetical protein